LAIVRSGATCLAIPYPVLTCVERRANHTGPRDDGQETVTSERRGAGTGMRLEGARRALGGTVCVRAHSLAARGGVRSTSHLSSRLLMKASTWSCTCIAKALACSRLLLPWGPGVFSISEQASSTMGPSGATPCPPPLPRLRAPASPSARPQVLPGKTVLMKMLTLEAGPDKAR